MKEEYENKRCPFGNDTEEAIKTGIYCFKDSMGDCTCVVTTLKKTCPACKKEGHITFGNICCACAIKGNEK